MKARQILWGVAGGIAGVALSRWKAIGEDYIENFAKSIRDLGFFG